MSTIKEIAEHAKLELVKANEDKKTTLEAHVSQFKDDVKGRDQGHQSTLDSNAKEVSEMESSMDAVRDEYVGFATSVISDLLENDEVKLDSIKEAVDTLAAADGELDDSMLKWGEDAAVRKAEMVSEIGDTVDVSRDAE